MVRVTKVLKLYSLNGINMISEAPYLAKTKYFILLKHLLKKKRMKKTSTKTKTK